MGLERPGFTIVDQEVNRIKKAFSDILKRPTYWDMVHPPEDDLTQRTAKYIKAYQRVLSFPETDKEQLDYDISYPESEDVRMMLLGLKPAAYGFVEREGSIKITKQYPQIEYATIEHSDDEDTIIPFDPAQAQVV
jgi:hypothetical protein